MALSFPSGERAPNTAPTVQTNMVRVARQQTNVSMDLSIARQTGINGGTCLA